MEPCERRGAWPFITDRRLRPHHAAQGLHAAAHRAGPASLPRWTAKRPSPTSCDFTVSYIINMLRYTYNMHNVIITVISCSSCWYTGLNMLINKAFWVLFGPRSGKIIRLQADDGRCNSVLSPYETARKVARPPCNLRCALSQNIGSRRARNGA